MYSENHKTLIKVEDNKNRWKDITCSWMGRFNIVKKTIIPKATYRFSTVSIKIPKAFFTEQGQIILKFVCKHKRPQIAKTILRKEHRAGEITVPGF